MLRHEKRLKKEPFIVERTCIVCRKHLPRKMLIRLTFDSALSRVFLNKSGHNTQKINGRSAYICPLSPCVEAALKGTRLKLALCGRQPKNEGERRHIPWPLESQLIKDIVSICTEQEKTCQNTKSKEGS